MKLLFIPIILIPFLILLFSFGCKSDYVPPPKDEVTGIIDLPDETAMAISIDGLKCVLILSKESNQTKQMDCILEPQEQPSIW